MIWYDLVCSALLCEGGFIYFNIIYIDLFRALLVLLQICKSTNLAS